MEGAPDEEEFTLMVTDADATVYELSPPYKAVTILAPDANCVPEIDRLAVANAFQ